MAVPFFVRLTNRVARDMIFSVRKDQNKKGKNAMKKLLAILICAVMLLCVFASCGERKSIGAKSEDDDKSTKTETKKSDETEEEPTTEETEEAFSAAGEWEMDISDMTDEELLAAVAGGFSTTAPGMDSAKVFEKLDVRELVESLMERYALTIDIDGTFAVSMTLHDFGQWYEDMMEELFDAFAEFTPEEYASISGMDEETLGQLMESISQAGMDWKSYLSALKETALANLKMGSDTEELKKLFESVVSGGGVLENDVYTISGTWTQSGDTVTLQTSAGSRTVLTLSRDGEKMKIISQSGSDSIFENGVSLIRK